MNSHSARDKPNPSRTFCATRVRESSIDCRLTIDDFAVVGFDEEARVAVEAERAAAQVQVELRRGNLDALFEEELADAVVDVAAYLRVAARPVRPDEESEI